MVLCYSKHRNLTHPGSEIRQQPKVTELGVTTKTGTQVELTHKAPLGPPLLESDRKACGLGPFQALLNWSKKLEFLIWKKSKSTSKCVEFLHPPRSDGKKTPRLIPLSTASHGGTSRALHAPFTAASGPSPLGG